MKKILMGLFMVLLFGISQTAFALPFLAPVPDDQPLYFKFTNYEQINAQATGDIEQNWGILQISTIYTGLFPIPGNQLFNHNTTSVWNDSMPGEITGIFYGIKKDSSNVTAPIASTGGFMDLYLDTNKDFNPTYIAASRTAPDKYTGATEGTFLARIAFLNGAISAGNPNTSIVGTVQPVAADFLGQADSFGSIVDINGDGIIDAADGAWAQSLDTNFFNTLLGANTADFRFKNSYNYNANWNGDGTIGATSDDPARAYSQPIPEPGTMLLLGVGLLSLACISRKRFNI
jgi:hypothetical protein